MAQKRMIMHISYITEPLSAALRTLFATLTLLFVCPGAWGQATQPSSGSGTSESPYIVTNAAELDWVFANGGYAELGDNIGDHGLTVSCTTQAVKLDLKGHTLSENYTFSDFRGPVITINSGCTVTILDTQGGGCITGGQTNGGKGAGISNSGTLTINGGTITGNNAPIDNTVSGYGGAIHNAPNATLTINGGDITGNSAHNAGGIYNEGNMYLRGGSIHHNSNSTGNSLSSGIYNTSGATLTISGNPVVENNGYGDIFLQNGMKITIDGELTGEEGRICIMMANYSQGAFTTGLKTGANYTNPEGFKYFKADNDSYEPYFDESNTNEISFYTNWVALRKRFAAGGAIKLNKDYTAGNTDGCLEVPLGKEVILDLNGKDINRHLTSATTDGCVIKNLGQLTIKDTGGAGLGTIRGGYNSGDGGGIVNIDNGILNIEGGEIYNNKATGNGAGIYHNGTSLNIKGRVRIHGNTGSYNDNNVYLPSGNTITINGNLDVDTRIGVTMAEYRRANTNTGVFTSGLSAQGVISNFKSDKESQYINVYRDGNGEAKLQTDWSYLQDAMKVDNTVTLDKDYRYGGTDAGGLSIPVSKTVTLNLNGHTIDRHLSSDITDGYVIKVDGTLTISGTGTITGGRNIGDGGGIVNNGTLTIQGGTITGNRATGHGGGIYHNGTTLTLSGAPVITGNTNTMSSSDSNIYLPSGNLITIGGSLTGADRSIGVSMQSPGTFTSGLASSTLHVKFSSDDANYDTAADNSNQAQLLSAWQALKKRLSAGESTIVLDKNYTAAPEDNYLSVPSGKNVTLDLNGHIINRNLSTAKTDGYVIGNSGTLTIKDSRTGGTITGGNNSDNTGGGIYNVGTLTIQGGSITGNTCSFGADGGGGICNRGTLTMSGGTISNNFATYNGGGIYNSSQFSSNPDAGSLTINGGTIENNSATNGGGGIYIQSSSSSGITISGGMFLNNSANDGGGIYLGSGTLSISGGTISDNTATSYGGGILYSSGTFNLSGNPTVVGNTVSGEANNIYLPNGKKITVNGPLTGTNGSIGITMEIPNTFTTGLTTNSSGNYEKFFPDASTTIKVVMFGGEAQLKSYWSYLQDLFNNASTDADHPTTIVLESGKVYKPLSNESVLSVPSYTYITLNLNGQTIDRGLGSSAAQGDGCVIYNLGNLRITGSGIITGGNNNDTGTAKGGGIYNYDSGTLTLEGASSIQNNKSTVGGGFYNAGTLYINGGTVQHNSSSLDGGGIYQASGTLYINGGTIQSNTAAIGRNGAGIFYDGGTFNLAGNPNISSNTVNSVANNVYLKGNNNITITNILYNTTAIGIVCEDGHTDRAFTSGLSGKGNAEKFTSNVAGREIGVNSLGEAIIGIPYTLSFVKNDASIYVNGNKYDNSTLSVVAGGHLKVQVQAPSGYIPISFTHTDGDLSPYPKSNVEYPFDMPGHDVTITAICKRGGYCGNPNENMKYYLDGTTLRFVTYDGTSQPMALYSSNNVPWRNYVTYNFSAVDLSMVSEVSPFAFFGSHLTSVNIPSNVTSIGTFAFTNCQSLTNLTVNGGTSFAADENVLYNYGKTNLICYPAGKTGYNYELPSTVTSVADGAFAYESHLTTITVAGGTAFMAIDGVLYGQNGLGTPTSLIYYPSAKADATYRMPTTVNAIADYAFFQQQHLTKIVLLHESVPTKGNHMLDGTSFPIMVKKTMKTSYTSSWGSSYQNRIYELDIAKADIYLSQTTYNYNGNPQSPNVTITYAGFTLEAGVDYSLRFDNDDDLSNEPDLTSVNPITVYITGIGDYAGTSYTRVYNINRSFTISVTGNYATYYATENLERPDNITVYTISTGNVDFENQKKVTLTELSYIPKGVPVLLYHDNNSYLNGTYSLSKKTTGLESITCDTRFRGVAVNTSYATLKPEGVVDIYVMKGNRFYKVDGTLPGELQANRCYLARLNSDPSPAPQFIGFAGETTEIEEIKGQMEDGRDVYYDLNGRRLMSKPTKKGIYIHNGKKVVIK